MTERWPVNRRAADRELTFSHVLRAAPDPNTWRIFTIGTSVAIDPIMDNTIDTASIEALRAFAHGNHLQAFADMCTAALPGWRFYGKTLRPVAAVYRVGATRMQDVIADCGACQVIPVVDLEMFGTSTPGEAWAVERVTHCIRSIAECVDTHGEGEIADGHRRFLIEITDTTRPDVAHKSCHVEACE